MGCCRLQPTFVHCKTLGYGPTQSASGALAHKHGAVPKCTHSLNFKSAQFHFTCKFVVHSSASVGFYADGICLSLGCYPGRSSLCLCFDLERFSIRLGLGYDGVCTSVGLRL